MIAAGRFHIHSATITYKAGRWYVSLNGVAGEFHHQRRSHKNRHQAAVGADRGLKTLMVAADADGVPFDQWEGVKALRRAEVQLRRANQALSRTKKGSAGRAKARARLAKLHARIPRQRSHIAHQASYDLAALCRVVCIEDLFVAGMTRNRSLAKSVADAAMGELGRRLGYKAAWYGAELHLADRWYASSKPARAAGTSKRSCTSTNGSTPAMSVGWRSTGTSTPPSTWPDGPPCRSSRPRLSKRPPDPRYGSAPPSRREEPTATRITTPSITLGRGPGLEPAEHDPAQDPDGEQAPQAPLLAVKESRRAPGKWDTRC